MTSEGHQHADRATDTTSSERGERSSNFGLFEAPEVPETFPTFTPGRHGDLASPFPRFGEPEQAPSETEQRPVDEPSAFTSAAPVNGGFSGFPPDTTEEPSSGSVYVPAPAVLPIPNPAVPDEDLTSWSSYSQNPTPARQAPEEQQSWSSFSHTPPPAEEQPAWSPYGAAPAEEPASTPEQQGWAAFTAPADQPVEQPAWSGFASAPPAEEAPPAWSGYATSAPPEQPQQFQEQPWSPLPTRQPEEPEQQTGWSAFTNVPAYEAPAEPAPVEAPAEQSWTSYESAQATDNPPPAEPQYDQRIPGATLEGSWPAFTAPHTTEPDGQWQEPQSEQSWSPQATTPDEQPWSPKPQAQDEQPWSPPQPQQPWTPQQAQDDQPWTPQTTTPDEQPWAPQTTTPDEQPWAPQVPAAEPSAVPVQPQQVFAPPADAAQVQPVSPAQPQVAEQPTRASASVPVASRLAPPAEAVPAVRPVSRVYGAPARAVESEDEPAGQHAPQAEPMVPQQASAPVQESAAMPAVARASAPVGRVSPEDVVLPPAATKPGGVYGRPQSTVYGSPAAAQAAAAAAQAAPAQATPQPSVYGTPPLDNPTPAPASAPQRTPGMPPYGDLLGPATPQQQAPQQPPSRQPAQPNSLVPSQRAPLGQPEPTQDRFSNFKPTEEAPPSVRSSKVLLLVIGACVALLGLALGTLWVVGNAVADEPQTFGVGQCVKQDGNAAVSAACTDAGAFSVTEIVNDKAKCPDPTQPTIEQSNGILCLKPAATS